jgi:non-canonical purine NTP pyrophosphatase (RdgB/HAM1 family)
MRMTIYFVTSNKGKFTEAKEIMPNLVQKSIEIEEMQSLDPKEVVERKAREAYKKIKKPLVVEDTALRLEALNGFPGAFIKHLIATAGTEGICKMLHSYRDRNAIAETAIAFHNGRKVEVFTSTTHGSIVRKPRGSRGFGFDFIFMPEGSKWVFAEMTLYEKNHFSARAKSFRKLKAHLSRK